MRPHEEHRAAVRARRRGPVAVVTLDDPAAGNPLTPGVVRELAVVLHEVQADPDVRAVVLTATGPVFCAGADLGARLGGSGRQAGADAGGADAVGAGGDDDGFDDEPAASLADVLSLLAELPQPVVARVAGDVRAEGMGLVAASDVAVAARTATFAFSDVRVGVAPAIAAVPALRVMGRRAFARYALGGETFGAAEAVTAGLLTAAVDPSELDGWVAGALSGVLRSSPPAVAATKDLLEGLDGRGWSEAMATAGALADELGASPAAAEGAAAATEGRPPSWEVAGPA